MKADENLADLVQPMFLGNNWKTKTFLEKISNEYVIGTVLYNYVQGHPKREEVIEKIFLTMQASGVHQTFQEFVCDLIFYFPEERPNLENFLISFDLEEILTGDHFVKRLEKLEGSILDFHPDSLTKEAWNKLKSSTDVLRRLNDPQIISQEKIQLVKRVREYIERYQKRASDINLGHTGL